MTDPTPTLAPLLTMTEKGHAFATRLVESSFDQNNMAEYRDSLSEALEEVEAQRAALATVTAERDQARVILRDLYEAVFTLHGNPEDCDECGALSDTDHNEPCALHGQRFTPVYRVLIQAEDALGLCQCGHARTAHDEDEYRPCKTCRCGNFQLPKVAALERLRDTGGSK